MKNAIVTGAGARLGQSMAVYLAQRGYNIAVHYRGSKAGADETVAQVIKHGCNAVALQADLLDEDQTQALISRAVDALGGPLQCLVNNASIFEHDTLETATRVSWDRHMESNLRAPYVLSQHFAAQCPRAVVNATTEHQAQGLIINMIDQRINKLTPDFSTYTIAKMGLWALTQTAARGLAPHIRVNAIGPGPTLQGHRQSVAHFAAQRQATILERGADLSDITAALGYFLDAPAVTGQILCVDGGQHLAWKTPDVLGPE